jgi:hypothetical protein
MTTKSSFEIMSTLWSAKGRGRRMTFRIEKEWLKIRALIAEYAAKVFAAFRSARSDFVLVEFVILV